jgi:glycine/D-amino acid oxidase-like deaminating enzyme
VTASADAVVVGGGIVGCAAAYFLAKGGMRVALVEKGAIAGEQSSRNWGFVRQQGRDPAEVPLMVAGIRLWRGLEAELGQDLEWRQGGNLSLARDEARLAQLEGWLEVAREHRIGSRIVTRREVADLVPGLAGPWPGGLYTASDGQAEPARVAPAFAAAAVRLGADVRTACAALAIDVAGGSVAGVATESGAIRARTVIVAAGAWSSRLLRGLGLSLPQQWLRATVARTEPMPELTAAGVWSPEVAFRQRRDGSFNVADGSGADYDADLETIRHGPAFLPLWRANRGFVRVRVGARLAEDALDRVRGLPAALRRRRTLDPAPAADRVANAAAGLARVAPGLGPVRIAQSWAGYIDMTPDYIPVLGPVDGIGGLVLATGFSGHGFGMGPIAGRLVAELVRDGRPSLDLGAFRCSRFRDGSPIAPRNVI